MKYFYSFLFEVICDYGKISQLSNVWWMPNSVRKGFSPAMGTGWSNYEFFDHHLQTTHLYPKTNCHNSFSEETKRHLRGQSWRMTNKETWVIQREIRNCNQTLIISASKSRRTLILVTITSRIKIFKLHFFDNRLCC